MRIREPKTTALVFKSGKMIVTGATTIEAAEQAAKKYIAIIQRAGFPAKFENFTVQNITATCDCGFPVSLEGFLYTYASNSTYEPELFPGLIYRIPDPKVVVLIFVSGEFRFLFHFFSFIKKKLKANLSSLEPRIQMHYQELWTLCIH